MIRSLLSGAAALLAVAPAFAHAGFLVPVADGPDADGKVLLHATFSDAFPQMEIGLTSEAWVIVTPEGGRKDFDRVAERPDRTLLQATLEEEGVYRLSSGERLGRKGEVARIDGDYVLLGRDGLTKESLPDGAEVLTSQTATVSDIYLARGDGPAASLESGIGRLAIRPADNPTDLRVGQAFAADILFESEPLAGYGITLFTPASSRKEGKADTRLISDESGQVAFTPDQPGEYLLMVRHIAPAPEGAGTDVRSYTTTLTLLVPGSD